MATYNQILRQRRMNLNLTIEDVSAQTRLAPEYIQAIEQHNLDAFSDDYSFARYFVHAYCDAIGVNWAVVQNEVDADISAYARQRQMALTLAQQRIVDEMESVTVEEEPEVDFVIMISEVCNGYIQSDSAAKTYEFKLNN